MAEPFVGQIMLCPYTFAPKGWADCAGQLLPISQNTALFSLLGTYYGGDGRSNFALPDLRGRAAVSQGQRSGGSTYTLGEMTGTETVTVSAGQLGPHNHPMNAVGGPATTGTAVGNSLAAQPGGRGGGGGHLYAPAPGNTTLGPAVGQGPGGGQSHPNIQPFLTLRYIIALQGVYPSRP